MRRAWAVVAAVGMLTVGAVSPAQAAELREGTFAEHALPGDSDGPRSVSAVTSPLERSDSAQRRQALSYDVVRLAGNDRFETAAAISYATFTDGPVAGRNVYIANGRNFPDALIAGPVAVRTGAALLLTETDSLPAPTRDELLRLRPEKVIVLGQEPSVSEAVRREIERVTGVAAERIGGANRFETADALVRSGFQAEGALSAFVVTGANFPDALAAGPVASTYGGPVVIAPPTGVTERETRLLEDLGVSEIVVIGDEAAVSAASYERLQQVPGVTFTKRVGGRDRFDTAAQLNDWLMGESESVSVATGEKFPDALAGGVLSGYLGAALVLTRQQCIPAGGADFIERTTPSEMIIYGSEASVGTSVETLTRCS